MVKDNFKSFEDRASIDNTLLSIYDKFYSNWPKYLRLAPITLFLTGVTQSLELDQKKTWFIHFLFAILRLFFTDMKIYIYIVVHSEVSVHYNLWYLFFNSLSGEKRSSNLKMSTTRIKKKAAPFCSWVEETQKIISNFFCSTEFEDFFHSRPAPGLYLKPLRR